MNAAGNALSARRRSFAVLGIQNATPAMAGVTATASVTTTAEATAAAAATVMASASSSMATVTTAASVAAKAEKVSLGLPTMDGPLGGGLERAALHEVFAAEGGDAAAASGFALALALCAASARHRHIVWVRHDLASLEAGQVYAPGLTELGANPDDFVLMSARDPLMVLRAGDEAVRCAALAAVIIELWGESAALDLTATRRFALSARRSGVMALLLRAGVRSRSSAATTRWAIKGAPSTQLAAGAPGHPAFDVTLLRHRQGIPGRSWRLEWNRDECRFREPTPLPRAVAAIPSDQPAAPRAPIRIARRAG